MHGCNPGWAGWAENEAANPADAIGMLCLGYVAPVTLRPQFFNPRKAHAYSSAALHLHTYPMTSQGEIGEMSCAEAIGGFASLSGSRGMLLAGLLTAVRRTVGSCVLTQFNDMSYIV